MKYLVLFNTKIVRQNNPHEWGVDKVLLTGTDLKKGKPNSSIDLSSMPQDKEAMVIYIPTVSDYNNSLSYDGANLALRILMHYIRNGRTDIDIVLLGNESQENFLLHYDYPNILKIPGISYLRFNKTYVVSYEVAQRKQLKTIEYKPYFDALGLKLPSSLKSTHSLTNEWCLYKWNSFMGFNETASSLEDYLYFDYLRTLERLNKITNKYASEHLKKRISDLPSCRILVVDDKEGWHDFFKELFASALNVEVHCLGEDFYKLRLNDIETKIRSEVSDFNPDIIILDFRLMEDHDADIKDDMKQISGYRVLANVLKGSFKEPRESYGRQVLVFTATSRIENILLLQNGNADGFILKEKPENYNGKEITKDVISKMVSTLEKAVGRAEFLIPLNAKLKNLADIVSNPQYNYDLKLSQEVVTASESVRLITQNNEMTDGVLKLVYLNIFKIFESVKKDSGIVDFPNDFSLKIRANSDLTVCSYNKSSICQKSGDDWNCTRKSVGSSAHHNRCKERDLNFAICAIILFRLGYNQVDDTCWNKIRLLRNALAHGGVEPLSKWHLDLSVASLKEYSLKMLDLLIYILDPQYIREIEPFT